MGSLFSDEDDDDDDDDEDDDHKNESGDKNVDAAMNGIDSDINSKTAYPNTSSNNDTDDIGKDIGSVVVENNIICKDDKNESYGDNNNNEQENKNTTINSNSIGAQSYTGITNTTKTILCMTNNDSVNETNTEILE